MLRHKIIFILYLVRIKNKQKKNVEILEKSSGNNKANIYIYLLDKQGHVVNKRHKKKNKNYFYIKKK